ncbi:hypothetical protein LTR56_000449 [Elasticomyces elasticus]|nr:hypothetical protein LTR22_014177 [Elasticomyces elasticus]KAK3660691.1 hypothetical protein LTR56_000449 [Elasticomyces elasticus]KAK4922837.1 hypothetical protein LTR49_009844 [Elasticomyces elasticus]
MGDHLQPTARGWDQVYREDYLSLDADISQIKSGVLEFDPELLARILKSHKWPVPTPLQLEGILKAIPGALFEGNLNLAIKLTANMLKTLVGIEEDRMVRLRYGVEAYIASRKRVSEEVRRASEAQEARVNRSSGGSSDPAV